MRTELASGAWIEHRPIGDLKGKDKRALAALSAAQLASAGLGDIGTLMDGAGNMDIPGILASVLASGGIKKFAATSQDAVWALVITGWSYDLPVPELAGDEIVNAASLEELPLGDYEEIERLMAPYQAKLARRPDPKGTTTSSSNGLSRASAGRGSPTG